MKIKDAMLLWSEDSKDVLVASKSEPRSDLSGYFFSTGSCWTDWNELNNDERVIVFLTTAIKQSLICDIPIASFSRELKKIDEIVSSFSENGWPICRPSKVFYEQK